jgi:acetate kinase
MAVLTLNAGSSSLKFALFSGGQAVLRGEFESITEAPTVAAHAADGSVLDVPRVSGTGHEAVLPALLDWVQQHLGSATLEAAGHRIVHGGDRFAGPVRIDDAVMAGMAALSPLAPLHQPHNLAAIRAVTAVRPDLPQVACFDTSFHRTLPGVARRHALPDRLGLQRYGFHGLSYEWIAGQLPHELSMGRVIAAHLGSGASLCALWAGQSVETTMSTTPLDGLVMGTRCGSLDAGVVLYLLQEKGMDAASVEQLLYHEAGLLGVSGVSADMRTLHASEAPAAAAAIELFAYRIAQQAGSLMAALGGIDGFVFTGGIGEHDGRVRALVVDRLGWMGIAIDPDAPTPGRISPARSAVDVWVIPTDEEAVIARQTAMVLGRKDGRVPGAGPAARGA